MTTNRQIAQALFVTQRTVENHLTSTYAKLQIAPRSALGAALGDSHPADAQPEGLRSSALWRAPE